MARTRAAKPAAEEARPAAVGKLFSETMCRAHFDNGGRDGLADSSCVRRARRLVRQATRRAFESIGWGAPFSQRRVSSKEGEQEAVVRAQRSRWERVTESDEFVGRLSLVDRLPQYLMT
jgi:hypothetical protein